MARKTEIVSVEFDGETRRFELTQFKPKDGHAVIERLLRIGAPILGPVATGRAGDAEEGVVLMGGSGEEEDEVVRLSPEAISGAFDAFAENITKNEGVLDWLVQKVRKNAKLEFDAEDVFVTPTTDQWDDLFAGEYGAEFDLIIAALKLNFARLASKGGGLGKIARRFVTPARSRSSSPRGAPSGSGDSS